MAFDHPSKGARIARFGLYELDLEAARLRREGILVRLQDQPLRLLAYLAERPGVLVTREELQKALWPSEFVDFDHSLNTAIRKLRAALDDSADQPRFVETLARRGYRFIAPVAWVSREAAVAPPSSAPPRKRMAWAWSIAAVLLIAAASAFVLTRRPAHEPEEVRSIAVLRFGNDEAASRHVSDGMTEILIDSL